MQHRGRRAIRLDRAYEPPLQGQPIHPPLHLQPTHLMKAPIVVACYTKCKEFLNVSRWYSVGPPPAFGGRRPYAEAAASPQGWPPLKPLPIQKVFDCKWYYAILRPKLS